MGGPKRILSQQVQVVKVAHPQGSSPQKRVQQGSLRKIQTAQGP